MTLNEAISHFQRLDLPRLTLWQRLKLAMSILLGKEPNSAKFLATSIGYGGFSSVVATDGFKELYIGVPGICRVWLKGDGTYSLDIPNEQAKPA